MEREFTKEIMQEIASEDTDDFTIIKQHVIDTTRWATVHEMIFGELSTGKFYRSYFNRGATEMQDERPYEYDSAIIKCWEVVEVEVMTKQWVSKED